MKKLSKNITILQWSLVSLLLMATALPTFASFSKGETLAFQGQFNEAAEILLPIAEKNNPRALYLMAIMYLSSDSNLYNPEKGLAFLHKAVVQGYPPALNELAGLYLAGEHVQKDETKALTYYQQASHKGYGPSQFNCGIMYKNGQGTYPNFVESYVYLTLASLNSDLRDVALDAATYRDKLVPFLSPTQRQEASRKINALTPHKPVKVKRRLASK